VIDKQKALSTIAENPWTALVLSPEGQIEEVIAFATQPTAEDVLALARRQARGSAFRLVPQRDITEAELDGLLTAIGGAQGYARTHPLRPGVNIPGKTAPAASSVVATLETWARVGLAFVRRFSPFR
jgi:hypothetical protein